MSVFDKLQKNGWQQDDVNLLKELTTLLQEGRMTVQVPNLDLDLNKGFSDTKFSKTTPQLFLDEVLIWTTSKGLINDPQCKNPSTNRPLSGFLHLHPKYVANHIDTLHEIFLENDKHRYAQNDKVSFIETIKEYAGNAYGKALDSYLNPKANSKPKI